MYNEYLMTNLRTMWGIDVCLLEEKYPVWWRNTKKIMDGYLERGLMISVGGGGLRLTEQVGCYRIGFSLNYLCNVET